MKLIKSHTKTQKGANMTEYALLCALVALFIITSLHFLGQKIERELDKPAQALNSPSSYDPNGSGNGECPDCE